MAAAKKRSLGRMELQAGTQQTLSNLFFSFDIYEFSLRETNMLLFLGTAEIDQIIHKPANNIAINIIKLNMVF
jgi:hypothetical protein